MSVDAADGLNDIYAALERYNWDADAEFQSGLSAIVGSNSTPEQVTELALRARCFYYSRKFKTNIDFDAYKSYRATRNLPPPTPPATNGVLHVNSVFPPSSEALPIGSETLPPSIQPYPVNTNDAAGGNLPAPGSAAEPPARYPTSFAEIVELISSGKPVPGIMEIPPTVLEGQGTEATKARRKKPWEKDEAPAAAESVGPTDAA